MRERILIMVLVLLFLSSSSHALIGPPTAELEKGQWSIGGNYTYSSQDLDKTSVTWKDYWIEYDDLGDVYDEESDSWKYKLEIRNYNTNLYYGRLGYGLLDSWEVYGQIGLVDVKAETKEEGDNEWHGYNLDNELAWGLGTKYTFIKKEKIDWGVALQLNMYRNSMDEKGTYETDWGGGLIETGSWKETTDIDTLGVLIAVGPTVDMGGWKLYGGAMYQLLTAEYEFKDRGRWEDTDDFTGSWSDSASGDYDISSFGGYIGAQFSIQKKFNVKVEGLGTNNGWGVGTGIEIPF